MSKKQNDEQRSEGEEPMSTEEDREALEHAIRAAVTDAMSRLTREEIHELVMEPYQALKEENR